MIPCLVDGRKCVVLCVPMKQKNWAESTAYRIGIAVKALRGKHSAQWLADRTKNLGHPISRTAISNLEVGRKLSLDVPELIVLAMALGVPPLLLLYPELSAGEVEVLPGQRTTAWSAAQWFAGRAPYTAMDKTQKVWVGLAADEDGARLLRRAQEEELLRLRLVSPAKSGLSADDLVEDLEQRKNAASRLRDVRREMKALGGEPLPWPEAALYGMTDADE